jgi:hypothetical protein
VFTRKIALALLPALAAITTAAADGPQWHGDGAAGEAFVVGPDDSRLAVRCDATPVPTVTVAYLAPAGVWLPVTTMGVNRWNIMFSFSSAGHDEGGSMHYFDEVPQPGGRTLYRLRGADDPTRDVSAIEDILVLVESFRHSESVQVASTETDAAGMPAPGFRATFSLGG